MVRSVGIDVGEFAVKTVELDGSYKKTRLVGYAIERLADGPTDVDARAAAAAAAAAAGLAAAKASGDKVLGYPCREAVLRTINVPFRGTDQIRKVIKSEVENAIHSHAVDDMVVDFHEVGADLEGGTRVLVASVPKPGLATLLGKFEGEAIEPERVELDAMALYRVADWCGALQVDAAEAGDGEAAAAVPALPTDGAARLTAVLDIGSRSTRVLLVDNGRLVDMRTLRLGDATIAEAVARANDMPLALAREAVQSCLANGADFQTEIAGELPAAAAADAEAKVPAVAAPRRIVVDAEVVERERAAFLDRLSREFVRFLAGSNRSGAITALWVTGGASRMAGMSSMLSEVFGVTPRQLDVLGNIKHGLSPDEVDEVAPQLAVAIGLALANIGGPLGFDFRQEDLAFTRGFDRIKSALAIVCMVALFAAVAYGVKQQNVRQNLEYRLGTTYVGADADPKKPRFYGELNPVVRSNYVQDPRYFQFQDGSNKEYDFKDLLADLVGLSVPDRIRFVRDKMRKALDLKQKESGIYEEVSLESGLSVLTRFFQVLAKAEPNMGRYLLVSLELSMRSVPGAGHSGRFLQCRFAFRGSDFRERFAALRTAVDEDCQRPDSPFEAIDERVGGDVPFRNGDKEGVNGAYYDIKVHIREAFAPLKF